MKKWYLFLVAFLLIIATETTSVSADKEESNTKTDHFYDIYPVPHHEVDLKSDWTITDDINVVIEDGIDKPTTDFLKEILDSHSINMQISDEVVTNKTNVMLGTKNSNGYVDSYMKEKGSYDDTVFDKIDSYVLSTDNKSEKHGTIAILGKDTDATYYGLASLKMIINQLTDNKIHALRYEDYADTKWRGFIEGFYGIPWSHESRKSLMKYGRNLKMNTYIFGPKDDKYHNQEWRKQYPKNKLAKIKELAQVGKETKTKFTWAIHPGFNMIDWDNYDQELDTLLAKFDQLYDVGVRQFGVFMDDIDTKQALKDRHKHVKLLKDIAKWVEKKKDVKPLIYTPPYYNQAWTGEDGKPYLKAMKDLPDNVEVMWTGKDVIGTVNQDDMQWPKDLMGRDPFVWLNWPVNGYAGSRLLLGEGDYFLKKGTHNISGVVSNPLEQAELSKVALFATNDFAWNTDDYNSHQSWKDSFKYITPNAATEFRTIAHHLSDPSPNSRGVSLKESENIKDDLNQFKDLFAQDKSVSKAGQKLNNDFDEILTAIKNFRTKTTNKALLKEIEPWLNSLEKVVEADKHVVDAATQLQKDEQNKSWSSLGKATDAMAKSKTFNVKKLDEDVPAEAGTKRLVPFANTLINQLDERLYTSVNPEATIKTPISSYKKDDLDKMVDGDESTYTYIQTIQKDGDWYGVDFGKKIAVHDIHILQGRDNDDHDIFQKGVLQYSNDKKDWKTIGNEQTGYQIDADNVDVKARYVRYKLTHAGIPGGKPDLWTAIREFSVNKENHSEGVYTNVSGLGDIDLQKDNQILALKDLKTIKLKPAHYIGIEMQKLEKISDIKLDSTNDDVTLETSENGVEWEKVRTSDHKFPDAAYVRLVNQTNKAVTFDLNKLGVEVQSYAKPKVKHNYKNVYEGDLDNLYNNDLKQKVWFGSSQNKGNEVQVDLGSLMDVDNVAVAVEDGEKDFFREGKLQLSSDGKSWKTVDTFDHPDDINQNFPDHEAPFRYRRTQTKGEKARYVRLLSTADHNAWLALNGLIINEGDKSHNIKDLVLQANPEGKDGYEVANVNDQKLKSFYKPSKKKAGSLHYKMAKETNIGEFVVLQNPATISNANVSIRDEKGWHSIGKLTKSLNKLDTSAFNHVLEMKLDWDQSVQPEIHEIIPVKREEPMIHDANDLKALINQFKKEDAFDNEKAPHALKMQITAVRHFEKQGETKKVIKHMKGFNVLLNDQKQNEVISKKAYNSLKHASEQYVEDMQ